MQLDIEGHVHHWPGLPNDEKLESSYMANILTNQNRNAHKKGMLTMPYRVEEIENDDYAVVYFFQWDTNATAEVFWSTDRAKAEEEAGRLNELEHKVNLRLQQAFDDLRNQVEVSADDLLNVMATWVTEKQVYRKEGAN